MATGYSTFGSPGLIEMPSAALPADGDLALGLGYFDDSLRSSLSFQISPRLSASFRYAQSIGNTGAAAADQSLSLHYLLLTETARRPAVLLGFNDVLGSDIYRSEFIAATKTVSETVRITAGLGWGRLAGAGAVGNPLALFSDSFETRDSPPGSGGSDLDLGDAFRGDMAHFGGVEWQATERLRLVAEYSSLDYTTLGTPAIDQQSPFNVGLSYAVTDHLTASAHLLYGSQLGVQLTYALNPKSPPFGQGIGSVPLPVAVRGQPQPADPATLQSRVSQELSAQGLRLQALALSGQTARIEVENWDHFVSARAVGRTARALSRTMPDRISTFDIILIENGIAVSSVRLDRSDIETLEHDLDGAWTSFVRAEVASAPDALPPLNGVYPRVDYGIAPYVAANISDPDSGLRADLGIDLNGQFSPAAGLVFSGTLRQKLGGTLEEAVPPAASSLPRVRSDVAAYAQADTTFPRLTGAYYFNAGQAVYGRVTAGLIEPMFGGISTELLWMPADSAFSLGAEVNYVVQRDTEQLFGFEDYDTVSGHLSGYWTLGQGFEAQLDVGRYLAGDWGGTLTLARAFDNGWRIGAFATLTDAPFDTFGQGDFDRGIVLTIPVGWASGGALRDTADVTLRPVLGDGGARLDVDGRLYDVVGPASTSRVAEGWGEFWR